MRASHAIVWLPAMTVALLAVSTVSAAGPPSKEPPPEAASAKHKADQDGDKLFDDFEAHLASAAPGEKIDALIRLSLPATAARASELSREVPGVTPHRRFLVVNAVAARVTRAEALALTRVPWVLHVEESATVRAFNASAQSSFGVTKARADVPSLDGNADGAASYSTNDLVAAVIDTGIDASHVELDGGKVIAFKDFVRGQTTPYDDNGHGTHVAGTIAGDAASAGVAPGAAIVGVKVLDTNGNGTMENVTAAIDWVVQNKALYGIEAINLSLGSSGCADGTDVTSVAVNNAVAAGLVVVVAAGNDGPGTCTVGSPGAAANAITVGAMSDLGEGGFGLASFSSRGTTADGRIKPEVVAPGVRIRSAKAGTVNGYIDYSGTSMATPFVVGVALLMRDANPALTPAQVRDAIVNTAVDWGRSGDNRAAGARGVDIDYGYGRLDAYAALKAVGAPLTTGPPGPAHDLREATLTGAGTYVDYALAVADTTFPIAATLIIPGIAGAGASSPDFDLQLFDPSGTRVAAAETTSRQEQVQYLPTVSGTYTLRVNSFSGSGGFFVDISAGLGTAPPGSTTVTLKVAASGDDGDVMMNSASYPPSGATGTNTTGSIFTAGRRFAYGSYQVLTALARFDTSSLPDAATVTSARLRIYVTGKADLNSRNVVGEWYPPSNWPIDGADYALNASATAFTTDVTTLSVAAMNEFTLQNLASLSKTGYTALRLHLDGGQPSADNYVQMATYDHATLPEPELIVTYTTAPTAPPTNAGLPVISGVPEVGRTLSGSTGTWTNSPTSYGYRWQRCDSTGGSCADTGATGSTYVVAPADAGNTLRSTLR